MESHEKTRIQVELYKLPITARSDDRSGRVVSAGTIDSEMLIEMAVARRTDFNAATLRAAMELLNDVALDALCRGATVAYGLGHYGLQVSGVFVGDGADWDRERHRLGVRFTPSDRVRRAVGQLAVEVRGMASSGTVINSVTDLTTGEVNGRLTPGGGFVVAGRRLRIVGTDPAVGLWLVSVADGTKYPVPTTSILVNKPSQLIAQLPATIGAGEYRIELVTQYGVSKELKTCSSYLFDIILEVL